MSTSKTSFVRTGITFGLSILIIAFAGWLYLNRQFALDQVTVWTYQPSPYIQLIDEKVAFTDKGRFAFYATKPVLAESEEFNTSCPRQEEGSPILGCYTMNDRIFVFNISNSKLEGMKEVTAAHEMLHAVWFRMSTEEQQRVEVLLKAAYEKSASAELKERMEYYQRTEPEAITNELHSILGTEIADLGPELEEYYRQYFENRQTVLALYSGYNTVYQDLYGQVDTLFASLQSLSATIESRSAAYDTDIAQLSADITQFNSRANSGDFDSVSQFNAEKAVLERRSAQLESQRNSISADITQYNKMYDEYEALASQIEVLNNSVDSFKALGEAPTV